MRSSSETRQPATAEKLYAFALPALTGVFPLLYLFTANIHQLNLSVLARPGLIILAAVAGLTLCLSLLLKDPAKSGLMTALLAILFFSYGHAAGALGEYRLAGIRLADYLFFLWIIILVRGWVILLKSSRPLKSMYPFLTLVAAGLVVFQGIIILQKYQGGIFHQSASPAETEPRIQAPLSTAGNSGSRKYPDIYYIILDTYPRKDTLSTVFGFDNSDFLNALEQRGFYMASQSSSNYVMTFLSLASSLNMQYLDHERLSQSEGDRTLPYKMIQNSKIVQELRNFDYQFVLIASSWGPTDDSVYADEVIRFTQLNEFNLMFLKTTAMAPFINVTAQDDKRMVINFTFDRLKNMPPSDHPRFILAHLLIPHPPYVFNQDGSAPAYLNSDYHQFSAEFKPAFIDSVVYTNRQMLQVVDQILKNNPDNPPIIVIQGDHGSSFGDRTGILKEGPWNHALDALASGNIDQYALDYLREKSNILNLYYLPGDAKKMLYPSISPVNTFRMISNAYFGGNYDLLEDKTIFSGDGREYEFYEVPSEILRAVK